MAAPLKVKRYLSVIEDILKGLLNSSYRPICLNKNVLMSFTGPTNIKGKGNGAGNKGKYFGKGKGKESCELEFETKNEKSKSSNHSPNTN